MEDRVEAFVLQVAALIEQRAGACADLGIGEQVGRRRCEVGQQHRVDRLPGEPAARQQGAGEAGADEAAAAGDENLHARGSR